MGRPEDLSPVTKAERAAVRWMKERGGDCAVARVKGGGRIYLAQGEHAPFMPWTAKRLVEHGLAEYVDAGGTKKARFRLIDGAKGGEA